MSIYVSEHNHIFLCEWYNKSIMEFTEEGQLVGECLLREGKGEGERHLQPNDISSISSDSLLVVAGWWRENEKLIFLEKKKLFPFLEIKNIIETGREMTFCVHCLCKRNGEILICDDRLKIDSFTKERNKIKTIKTAPLIHADPSNRIFWLVKGSKDYSFIELFYFDEKGQKIHSMKIEEKITDFFFQI